MDNNSNSVHSQNRGGSGRLTFRTEHGVELGCRARREDSWESNGHDLNWRGNIIEGPSRVDTSRHPLSVGASGDSDHPGNPRRLSPPEPKKVLLVHGLDRVPVNCDRVFNLFCLYGNVTTVKILRDDKVLVELEDVEAAKRCVSNLHMLQLDDDVNMKVKYSKHNFIHDQVKFNTLADGTPAQKVYLSSTLNRFFPNDTCPDKRRIAAPSKIIHFFNAPTDVCGIAVHRAVSSAICHTDAIRSITILPKKPKAKCSTGLIELKSMALAAKTVLLSNHMTIESKKSRFPFLTKLCFSKWSDIEQKPGDSTTLRFSSVTRTPWLLHRSEYGVPTTEFPISCTTVVNGCDCLWTLWEVNSRQREQSPPAVEESVVVTDDATADSDPTDQSDPTFNHDPTVDDDVDSVLDLIDMLRNRLCDIRNDRGDVLWGPAALVDHDSASIAADTASQLGPLGDA